MKNRERKFIRNILIGTISLFIAAFILNIAPGYKRDTMKDRPNLVINDENVTEELKNKIYIDENQVVYLSKEDVAKFLDNTLYYDEDNNQIITSSDTKVANIVIGENKMKINDSNVNLSQAIIKKDNIIYMPIAQISLIYNIKVEYHKETNIVVIDMLNKGLIIANISENVNLKFKARALSKTIAELKTGQIVSCFYTTSKGWRQIRTEDRSFRIC